jgi:hypothetical protein
MDHGAKIVKDKAKDMILNFEKMDIMVSNI